MIITFVIGNSELFSDLSRREFDIIANDKETWMEQVSKYLKNETSLEWVFEGGDDYIYGFRQISTKNFVIVEMIDVKR